MWQEWTSRINYVVQWEFHPVVLKGRTRFWGYKGSLMDLNQKTSPVSWSPTVVQSFKLVCSKKPVSARFCCFRALSVGCAHFHLLGEQNCLVVPTLLWFNGSFCSVSSRMVGSGSGVWFWRKNKQHLVSITATYIKAIGWAQPIRAHYVSSVKNLRRITRVQTRRKFLFSNIHKLCLFIFVYNKRGAD